MNLCYIIYLMIWYFQSTQAQSNCSLVHLCQCDHGTVLCDGKHDIASNYNYSSLFALLPPSEKYIFRDFKIIQANTLTTILFPANRTITIHLVNAMIIESNSFSSNIIIPSSSKLLVDIEYSANTSTNMNLQVNAFNHINIDRLRFLYVDKFNGLSILNTDCFGEHVTINELIFERSAITGFSSSGQNTANIKQLRICECSTFTHITSKSLPAFLLTTDIFEISQTALQSIDAHTFQAKLFVLKELIIRNNTKLKTFPFNIIDGTLVNLVRLDLSYNSIMMLETNYDWLPYNHAKQLILKQQPLDLYFKTSILKALQQLQMIDFSEGFISNSNHDLIYENIPNMPDLIAMNISYTNLTEQMIIKILDHISFSRNQTIMISLLGRTLHQNNFCSYFRILKRSSFLIQLELDDEHECNCVVDLFFNNNQHRDTMISNSFKQPLCLLNRTRTKCNIESYAVALKCLIDRPSSDEPQTNNNPTRNYLLMGIMVGVGVLFILLLAFGSGVAYRRRQEKNRSMTVLDMEEPIVNPLATVIEQRSSIST